jgi:hypothetical protein
LGFGIFGPTAQAEAPPSVKDVMRRVAAYVDTYGERAAIVVATERYTQETTGNTSAVHTKRTLLSEFAIVKVNTVSRWLGFRDVLEVDGRKLSDHEDRLIQSLTGGGAGYQEALRLSNESARFNIGTIERNFNVPTTALFYFAGENQDRFKFSAKTVDANGIWHIAFKETYRPTLIRTPEGQSVPSEGELWADPADGTVVRTILKTDLLGIKRAQMQHGVGRVQVTYQFVEPMGMWLPQHMSEMFEATGASKAWERVEGNAEYSNYRKFTTMVRIK